MISAAPKITKLLAQKNKNIPNFLRPLTQLFDFYSAKPSLSWFFCVTVCVTVFSVYAFFSFWVGQTRYGLKSLICHLADLRKKSRICSKRKARTSWDIHTLTRNAHQLYNTVSSISAQKIYFTRPNGDFTFIQTSCSHKGSESACSLSLASL